VGNEKKLNVSSPLMYIPWLIRRCLESDRFFLSLEKTSICSFWKTLSNGIKTATPDVYIIHWSGEM